jgi:16S rRNA (cytidine1402-2'-O)-methyltransferase
VVAAEDTRTTGNLLRAMGLEGKRLLSHHAHNVEGRVPDLVRRALGGASIAVVSDAGTPGASHPTRPRRAGDTRMQASSL